MARMVGNAIVLGRQKPEKPVAFSSPAAGTTFYAAEATSVTLTGPDATYETSWQSDFASTNGDITVSGGTGSGNVTPTFADGTATVERATLYVRNKAVGGVATAYQSAPIFCSPHAAVQDGTVELSYDLARAAYVTQGAGVCTAISPIIGGTAADVLIAGAVGTEFIYNATDSDFGGRPSVQGTGTQWMTSTTAASASTTSVPFSDVAVGISPGSASSRYYDSADSARRAMMWMYGSRVNIYSGSTTDTSTVIPDNTEATMLIARFDGGTTDSTQAVRQRKRTGNLQSTPPPLDISGSDDGRGLTLLARYDGATPENGKFTSWMRVTNLSPADIYRLEVWMQLSVARGGIAATGWTPALNPTCHLSCTAWWPTDSANGTVSLASDPSEPDDPSTWNGAGNIGLVVTGSGPYSMLGDGNNTRHNQYHQLGNNSYPARDVYIVCQAVNGHQWLRIGMHSYSGSTESWVNIDLTNGVQGNADGSAWADVSKVGSTVTIVAHSRAVGTGSDRIGIELLSVDDATDTPGTFVLATNTGISLIAHEYRQAIVNGVADQSGNGSTHDLSESTLAQKPVYDFVSLNGENVITNHNGGSGCGMQSTGPSMVAIATAGADIPYVVFGIGYFDNNGADPERQIWWYGPTGPHFIQPIIANGANTWYASRRGVAFNEQRAYTAVTDATMQGWHTWAVLYNRDGTRKCELYLDGSLIDTTAAFSSDTSSNVTRLELWRAGYDSNATGNYGDVAILYGPHSYLDIQATLQTMADPYGLTA